MDVNVPSHGQRKEEVFSNMREPVVSMVKVLPADEKPAGHL